MLQSPFGSTRLLLAYWLSIFVLTHIPGSPSSGGVPSGYHLDKIAHFAAFYVLTLFLLPWIRSFRSIGSWAYVISLAIVAAYAAADEVTQSFVPHRCPDIKDWCADLGGYVAAVVTYRYWQRSISA